MSPVPLPHNEQEWLQSPKSHQVLDSPAEDCFDAIAKLASSIGRTPIALVSLLDGKQQSSQSRLGWGDQDPSRELAFCGDVMLGEEIFEVKNALEDERFFESPVVTGAPKKPRQGGCQRTATELGALP